MSAIATIIRPRERDLGGFSVRRVLPAGPRQMVGPFIFFDALGPAMFAPGTGVDVRPHPHIGLATVTWLFEGELLHRDSLGCTQLIRPGEVNWMTAGSGIAHSERTPLETRSRPFRLHAIQSWVALPKSAEETAPEFRHYAASELARTEGRRRLPAGYCRHPARFDLTGPDLLGAGLRRSGTGRERAVRAPAGARGAGGLCGRWGSHGRRRERSRRNPGDAAGRGVRGAPRLQRHPLHGAGR